MGNICKRELSSFLDKILANKMSKRQNKTDAVNLAASIRDSLEFLTNKLLEKKLGTAYKEVVESLDIDFDRLEDKLYKRLIDYFEYKTNNEEINNKESNEENSNEENSNEENSNEENDNVDEKNNNEDFEEIDIEEDIESETI